MGLLRRMWNQAPTIWRLAVMAYVLDILIYVALLLEIPGTEPLVRYFGQNYLSLERCTFNFMWAFLSLAVCTGPILIKPSTIHANGARTQSGNSISRSLPGRHVTFPPVNRLFYFPWVGSLLLGGAILWVSSLPGQRRPSTVCINPFLLVSSYRSLSQCPSSSLYDGTRPKRSLGGARRLLARSTSLQWARASRQTSGRATHQSGTHVATITLHTNC